MQTLKKIMLILVIVAAIITVAIFYAPRYLAYSTNYKKVDAVVILLGPVFNDREKHARDLIEKGMADYLIIPAYNKTYHVDHGTLKPLSIKTDKNNIPGKNNTVVPPYYEDTHLELIEAKKTMKMYGHKSAIFVSSPYHMRRIQIMVHKEFDRQSEYYFSPTPYDQAPLNIWELKASDWRKVRRECAKIVWFMIYYPWT